MNEILTRKERIRLLDNGILHCETFESAYLEYEDGLEIIDAVRKIASEKPLPVIVDIRKAKGASHSCRKLFTTPELAMYQSAVALMVDSPLTNLIGNFFIGLNKTPFPTKLFSNEEKAFNWLKTYLNDETTEP